MFIIARNPERYGANLIDVVLGKCPGRAGTICTDHNDF